MTYITGLLLVQVRDGVDCMYRDEHGNMELVFHMDQDEVEERRVMVW